MISDIDRTELESALGRVLSVAHSRFGEANSSSCNAAAKLIEGVLERNKIVDSNPADYYPE